MHAGAPIVGSVNDALGLPAPEEAVLSHADTMRTLDITPAVMQSLLESGRLVPIRAERNQGLFQREEVLKIAVLLRRARQIARARRISQAEVVARAHVWSEHLRHEAHLVRAKAARPGNRDVLRTELETLARTLDDAARLIERTTDTH